ncbi:SbtR family transcriptional regulator [Gordonia aurantiaca]|uniref:SbtR family transcriptional regulator n=1 Tax=Gordonia sp. B21 TaxID=3151852 RepID=UPI003264FDD3
MRADAARRREAIVREARRLFAAHGGGVALEAVAEAAGVGIATLYRNFESRHALADEVAQVILDDIGRAADEAAGCITDSPDAAWTAFVHRLVELDLGALSAALAEYVTAGVRETQALTLERVEDLLDAAKDAGLVRSDLRALELIVGIGLITRPQPEPVSAATPDLVPRLVSILLAGMRP